MNPEPLVSIITPCFNAEEFIAESVESALNQTYEHVEVIVVDDGSSDSSLQILRSYGDRIKLVEQANRGACAARNLGLNVACGELIQFNDADDCLYANKLAVQVPLMLERNADAICSRIEARTTAGEYVATYGQNTKDSFRAACFDLLSTPGPVHWAHDLKLVGGFREELPCSQEKDLHIRLACHGKTFQAHDEVLGWARKRDDSVSSNYLQVLEQFEGIVESGVEILADRGVSAESDDVKTLSELLVWAAMQLLTHGATDSCKRMLRRADRLHQSGGREPLSKSTRFLLRTIGVARTASLRKLRKKFLSLQ